MGKARDLTGEVFGRWTVLHLAGKNGTRTRWECECECGTVRPVIGCNLVGGISKSCGCLKKEIIVKMRTKHGMCGSPEYIAWKNIKIRCYNPKFSGFHRYGGRGIAVCDEWRNSFEDFYNDMGDRPSKGHSIDRIDNDGNYEPSNCKWSTKEEQMSNRSNNVFLKYKGQTETTAYWAREFNIHPSTIAHRISKGWSVNEALETKKE